MRSKIPARYRPWVFALLMSFATALLVSGAITVMHAPAEGSLLGSWCERFLTAWPIVFLSILLVAPWVQRLTALLVASNDEDRGS